jgi:hypothetical protein
MAKVGVKTVEGVEALLYEGHRSKVGSYITRY